MRYRMFVVSFVLSMIAAPGVLSASSVEKIRHEKVLTMEVTLSPGESEQIPEKLLSMLVYMSPGVTEITTKGGKKHKEEVTEGETVFQAVRSGLVKNAGSEPLHYARVEFLTVGLNEFNRTHRIATLTVAVMPWKSRLAVQ